MSLLNLADAEYSTYMMCDPVQNYDSYFIIHLTYLRIILLSDKHALMTSMNFSRPCEQLLSSSVCMFPSSTSCSTTSACMVSASLIPPSSFTLLNALTMEKIICRHEFWPMPCLPKTALHARWRHLLRACIRQLINRANSSNTPLLWKQKGSWVIRKKCLQIAWLMLTCSRTCPCSSKAGTCTPPRTNVRQLWPKCLNLWLTLAISMSVCIFLLACLYSSLRHDTATHSVEYQGCIRSKQCHNANNWLLVGWMDVVDYKLFGKVSGGATEERLEIKKCILLVCCTIANYE